jgi:hypothetical protein
MSQEDSISDFHRPKCWNDESEAHCIARRQAERGALEAASELLPSRDSQASLSTLHAPLLPIFEASQLVKDDEGSGSEETPSIEAPVPPTIKAFLIARQRDISGGSTSPAVSLAQPAALPKSKASSIGEPRFVRSPAILNLPVLPIGGGASIGHFHSSPQHGSVATTTDLLPLAPPLQPMRSAPPKIHSCIAPGKASIETPPPCRWLAPRQPQAHNNASRSIPSMPQDAAIRSRSPPRSRSCILAIGPQLPAPLHIALSTRVDERPRHVPQHTVDVSGVQVVELD